MTPYTVRRTYEGAVDEMLPATDTLIMSGEITMDESKVTASPGDDWVMDCFCGHVIRALGIPVSAP